MGEVTYLSHRRRLVAESVQGVAAKAGVVSNAALYQGLVQGNKAARDALLKVLMDAPPGQLYVCVPYHLVHWVELGAEQLEALYRSLLEVEDDPQDP